MSKARLNELFDEWLDHYDAGEIWSPEEICRDDPDLIEPLRARIEFWLDMHSPKRISLPPARERRSRYPDEDYLDDDYPPPRGRQDRRDDPYREDDYPPAPRDAIAETRNPGPPPRHQEAVRSAPSPGRTDDEPLPPVKKRPVKKSSGTLVVVLILGGVVLVIGVIVGAWVFFSQMGLGKKVKVGQWEVYYKGDVEKHEAIHLGRSLQTLLQSERARRVTLQLLKSGDAYTLRIPIKGGMFHDPKIKNAWRINGAWVKTRVLRDQPLTIHLCDLQMKTKEVIMPYASQTFRQLTICYDSPFPKDRVRKTGEQLVEKYGFGVHDQTVLLGKAGPNNKLVIVLAKEAKLDPQMRRACQDIANTLSRTVFSREPVVVEIIREDLTKAGSFRSKKVF